MKPHKQYLANDLNCRAFLFSPEYLLAKMLFKNKGMNVTEKSSMKKYRRKELWLKKSINKRIMMQLNTAERIYSLLQEIFGPIQLVSKSCFLKKDRFEDTKNTANN